MRESCELALSCSEGQLKVVMGFFFFFFFGFLCVLLTGLDALDWYRKIKDSPYLQRAPVCQKMKTSWYPHTCISFSHSSSCSLSFPPVTSRSTTLFRDNLKAMEFLFEKAKD
jgi:hypothetical protein